MDGRRKWQSMLPRGESLVQRYVASLPPSEASSSMVMHVAAVVAAACSWILASDWWTRCCLYSWAATRELGETVVLPRGGAPRVPASCAGGADRASRAGGESWECWATWRDAWMAGSSI